MAFPWQTHVSSYQQSMTLDEAPIRTTTKPSSTPDKNLFLVLKRLHFELQVEQPDTERPDTERRGLSISHAHTEWPQLELHVKRPDAERKGLTASHAAIEQRPHIEWPHVELPFKRPDTERKGLTVSHAAIEQHPHTKWPHVDVEEVGTVLDAYPEYGTTSRLDELRATEYGYLDKQDHVYLDYTGSGLAAVSQHRAHEERLANKLCGNPHSMNPTSEAATQLVDQTRARILEHLNASPDEYAVVFTPNASAAARLVGEAYPFNRRTKLVLTADNHNSINGLREFAGRRNTRTVYVPVQTPELRIDPAVLTSALHRRNPLVGSSSDGRSGLFAYPAQSNFSGVRHPLSWVSLAQKQGYDVLLDTAAYLPTGTLDLSVVKPEFMIVSWYKLFGYPTGVGCLVAKHSALKRLTRPWFSGGTIRLVSVAIPWHEMAQNVSAFEDGTLNFLSIPDVLFGLDWLAKVGMSDIATRVRCLTGWFLNRLKRLEHSDGTPMIRIYGPTDTKSRGGTVAFNFLDLTGKVVDERTVAIESAAARISLRTGCFCNPGVAEHSLDLNAQRLRPLRHTKFLPLDEQIALIGLPSAGAVRVSFGLVSTAEDVDRFFVFAEKTYRDRVTTTEGLIPRENC